MLGAGQKVAMAMDQASVTYQGGSSYVSLEFEAGGSPLESAHRARCFDKSVLILYDIVVEWCSFFPTAWCCITSSWLNKR